MTDETTTSPEAPETPHTTDSPSAPAGASKANEGGNMSERASPDRAQELSRAAAEASRDGTRTGVLKYMQQKRSGAD